MKILTLTDHKNGRKIHVNYYHIKYFSDVIDDSGQWITTVILTEDKSLLVAESTTDIKNILESFLERK